MALTAGRDTAELAQGGKLLVIPVAAKAVIFEGSLVALDAEGYALPAAKAEGLTAAGRAEAYADNRQGAAGAVMVQVTRGTFLWDNSANPEQAVTAAHLLQDCYMEDDHTVCMAESGASVAGKVISVSDEGVAVETR